MHTHIITYWYSYVHTPCTAVDILRSTILHLHEHHALVTAHTNTQAPWLAHRGERDTRVLGYRSCWTTAGDATAANSPPMYWRCTAAVVVGVVSLVVAGMQWDSEVVWSNIVLPSLCETMMIQVCVRSDFLGKQGSWHTHAHTYKHGSPPSQWEALDVRLLLCRACRYVKILASKNVTIAIVGF